MDNLHVNKLDKKNHPQNKESRDYIKVFKTNI